MKNDWHDFVGRGKCLKNAFSHIICSTIYGSLHTLRSRKQKVLVMNIICYVGKMYVIILVKILQKCTVWNKDFGAE